MEFLLIGFTAFGASLLTFFSGFGLGTILLPVFALFFPLEIAVLLTAVVHFLNNIFKTSLMWKHIDWKVLFLFGFPAMLGAYFGAKTLSELAQFNYIVYSWRYADAYTFNVSLLSLIIGGLIFLFAVTEITYSIKNLKASAKFLIPGGILSGFFGGLSGHQGALRTVFLLHAGLDKNVFIATGIAIALCIDATRITQYISSFGISSISHHLSYLLAGIVPAFAGAILGRKLLQKITIKGIRYTVGIAMAVLALGILSGILSNG